MKKSLPSSMAQWKRANTPSTDDKLSYWTMVQNLRAQYGIVSGVHIW